MGESEYVIAPENGLVDFEALFRDIVRTGQVPDRVAHLALLATDDRQFRPGSSFFHRNQELGFQSLVFIAQAWAATELQRPLHLTVATMGSQHVVATDRVPWAEQSTVLGPVKLIPREMAEVTASTFDIDQLELFPESRLRTALEGVADVVGDIRAVGLRRRLRGRVDHDEARPTRDQLLLDMVFDELTGPASNDVVALRDDRRFVQDVRPIEIDDSGTSRLRQGGVVLVTGGLGGIGLTVAEQLVDECGARLALLSRSPLPDREAWDDLSERLGPDHPTAQRIAGVRALEAKGADVLLVDGDVTDVEQMTDVVARVRSRFGAIHGVVHAAGVVDDELMVAKDAADMEDVLAPKVYGTLVLEESVADQDLDLFVVFSSTSTVTAPLGQVDYVAANAFLNAFAEARRADGRRPRGRPRLGGLERGRHGRHRGRPHGRPDRGADAERGRPPVLRRAHHRQPRRRPPRLPVAHRGLLVPRRAPHRSGRCPAPRLGLLRAGPGRPGRDRRPSALRGRATSRSCARWRRPTTGTSTCRPSSPRTRPATTWRCARGSWWGRPRRRTHRRRATPAGV